MYHRSPLTTLLSTPLAVLLAGLLSILWAGCPHEPRKPHDNVDSGATDATITGDLLPSAYPDAERLVLVRGPYLQNVTDTSIVIMWEAAEPCRGLVEAGSGSHYQRSEPSDHAERHEITITGLPTSAADLSYRIRCVTGPDAGFTADAPTPPEAALVEGWHPFRMAPGVGDPYRLLVYGDNRTLFFMHEEVTAQMLNAEPDLVVNVGDLVTDGNVYDQWDQEFFWPAEGLLRRVPMFVAIGNHEQDADHFYELLSQPPPENYFTFTYGNSFNIVLDSNPDKLYAGSEQLLWFEEAAYSAAAQSATWLFAYAHHPPYSEGWDAPGYDGDLHMRELIVPVAEDAGIDLFWNGHTHDYERGALNGVTWIITGGGGASLDSFQQNFDHILVYESAWHYVQVDIAGPHATVSAVDLQGVELDRFTLTQP